MGGWFQPVVGAFERFVQFLSLGGFLMIPILACSVVAVAVIAERLSSYGRAAVDTRRFLSRVLRLVREDRVAEAVEICQATPGPVAKVLEVGLLRRDRSLDDLMAAMKETGAFEMVRLERYLPVLATVAQVSPLLGLLGTVTGLIEVFMTIQAAQGNVNAGDLAGGIWQALITTAAGLSVAIPALVAYNYLTRRADALAGNMEIAAKELLDVIKSRQEGYEALPVDEGYLEHVYER